MGTFPIYFGHNGIKQFNEMQIDSIALVLLVFHIVDYGGRVAGSCARDDDVRLPLEARAGADELEFAVVDVRHSLGQLHAPLFVAPRPVLHLTILTEDDVLHIRHHFKL